MRFALILAGLIAALVAPGTAAAAITATSNARSLADAMSTPGAASAITSASFPEIPPAGTPHAVVNSPLGGFPTDGTTFTILSDGDAQLADDPNSSGSSGAGDGGPQGHGDTSSGDPGNAYDTSILRVNFTTPPGTNCVSFGFRFLS